MAESGYPPWFLPAFVVWSLVATVLAAPAARALGTRRWVAWLLIASFGAIASATLTPLRLAFWEIVEHPSACDLTRIGLAPLEDLVRIDDTSLNILLFVPLGVALALLPRSTRRGWLTVAAIALPFAIEVAQLLLPVFDRACQSADVFDNLTGLVLGALIGVVLGRIAPGLARPVPEPPPEEDGAER